MNNLKYIVDNGLIIKDLSSMSVIINNRRFLINEAYIRISSEGILEEANETNAALNNFSDCKEID